LPHSAKTIPQAMTVDRMRILSLPLLIFQHTSFPRRNRRIRLGDTDVYRPRESAGGNAEHHRSRDAAGIRGLRQAAQKRHETFAFERSRREAGGGVRPFIPIQARKAKKEKRKKEGGTPADA
jgi:hypothetical protein